MTRRPFRGLQILVVSFVAGVTWAQSDTPITEAARQNAAKKAARLAEQVLPSADKIGPGWRAPWQLPATWREGLMIKGDSKAAYWEAYEEMSPFPAGLDKVTAEGILKEQSNQYGGEVNHQQRFAWMEMAATTLRPPAETLENAARLEAIRTKHDKAVDAPHENSAEYFESRQEADREWRDTLTAEIGGEAAVHQRLMDLLLMPRVRVELMYIGSNDWQTLDASSPFEEMFSEKGRANFVSVTVVIVDETKVGDLQDYTGADLKRIEARATKALTERYDFHVAQRPMMLPKSHSRPTLEFKELPYGTGCHQIKATGSTGLTFGSGSGIWYAAWLRNGPALVRVELQSGKADDAAEATMRKLLELMDAATQVFALDDG